MTTISRQDKPHAIDKLGKTYKNKNDLHKWHAILCLQVSDGHKI